ncbi:MAG TPA: hypothetical protein VIQ24_20335 [Pyrinomonadaceae bacterium]
MKKYLLTFFLVLGMPLVSLSQAQSRKPASQSKGQKARPPAKDAANDEDNAEIKIGQPKRISTQAFIDVLNKGRNMVESGELDLNAPIEMEVTAERSRTGTLSNIGINQKVIAAPQRELAKEFIETLSSSGALEFLEGVRHIVFTLRLNGDTLSVSASSELPSAKKAAQLAQASTLLLEVGAKVKRGRDEEIIYKGANVSANGKRVTATLSLPRGTVADLLSKQLQSSSGQ